MSSKTKIIVLHMKEVVYTAVFLLFLVILGILLFFMFGPGKTMTVSTETVSRYTPGVYRSSIQLNNNTFDVEVTMDTEQIQSVRLTNLSETTQAMFPLIEPVLEDLASQINAGSSLEALEYSSDRQYTARLLIEAIRDARSKAETNFGADT